MKTKVQNSESNDTMLKVVFALVTVGIAVFAYFVVFVHPGNIN